MFSIFSECSSLIELNLDNFNFNGNNRNKVSGIFSGCSNEFKNKMRIQYKNINEAAYLF